MIQPNSQPVAAPPEKGDALYCSHPPKYWCCMNGLVIIQLILGIIILILGLIQAMDMYQGIIGGTFTIICAIAGMVANVK